MQEQVIIRTIFAWGKSLRNGARRPSCEDLMSASFFLLLLLAVLVSKWSSVALFFYLDMLMMQMLLDAG